MPHSIVPFCKGVSTEPAQEDPHVSQNRHNTAPLSARARGCNAHPFPMVPLNDRAPREPTKVGGIPPGHPSPFGACLPEQMHPRGRSQPWVPATVSDRPSDRNWSCRNGTRACRSGFRVYWSAGISRRRGRCSHGCPLVRSQPDPGRPQAPEWSSPVTGEHATSALVSLDILER
jgi:hypothetical protein